MKDGYLEQRILPDLVKGTQRALIDFLVSLENGNVGTLDSVLDVHFRTADRMSLGLNRFQILQCAQAEFRNINGVEFRVLVNTPRVDPDQGVVMVDLTWDRRARFGMSGQEWILRNMHSTVRLHFDLARVSTSASPNAAPTVQVEPLHVMELQGDNFIRTNFVGVTAVDEGTIDGKQLATTQGVLGGVLGAGNNQLIGFSNLLLPLPVAVSSSGVAKSLATPSSTALSNSRPLPIPTTGPHAPPVPGAGPDLAVFSVNVQQQGTPVNPSALVLFSVGNIGSSPAAATIVDCVVDDREQFFSIGALGPGASTSGVLSFANLHRGTHTLTLTVAPVPGETNISNNRVTQTFFLTSAPSTRRVGADTFRIPR